MMAEDAQSCCKRTRQAVAFYTQAGSAACSAMSYLGYVSSEQICADSSAILLEDQALFNPRID